MKTAPHFTPPRPEFFTATPEDQQVLDALRHADRQLAHAEQELRGAMALHEKARVAHVAAETAFANTEAGRAYHASYVEIVQNHQAACARHAQENDGQQELPEVSAAPAAEAAKPNA